MTRVSKNEVEKTLTDSGIEFRRGLSGGGNQLRQPYLRNMQGLPKPETLKVADHIHHFAWYIGNYPDLQESRIFELGKILTNLK
jgi:CDP-6-deoxy-D-xylo-4-hexulose-3-dehydrase